MYDKEKDFGVKYSQINVENFRDLGGIEVANGKVIRDHMIFRSGELTLPSEFDQAELDKLGIDCIFDLRCFDEVEFKPDYVPQGAAYHNIPAVQTRRKAVIKPDDIVKMIPTFLPSGVSRRAFRGRCKRLYRSFPFNNPAYRKIFDAMDEGKKILFHCTAGKDRTGIASMLILLALGADVEDVRRDYMLSNFYREESNKKFVEQFSEYKHYEKYKKILPVTCVVKMEYFDACYNKIIRKYGTVKNFLLKQYGIDDTRVNKWLNTYAM